MGPHPETMIKRRLTQIETVAREMAEDAYYLPVSYDRYASLLRWHLNRLTYLVEHLERYAEMYEAQQRRSK